MESVISDGDNPRDSNLYEEFYKAEYKDNWKEAYYDGIRGAFNCITIRDLQFETALHWIEKELQKEIQRKTIMKWGDEEGYYEASFILANHILLHLHSDFFVDILFYDSSINPTAEELAKELESLKPSGTSENKA